MPANPTTTTRDRIASLALFALTLVLLFVAFSAAEQSRCSAPNTGKAWSCDGCPVDAKFAADAVVFAVPAGLSVRLALFDEKQDATAELAGASMLPAMPAKRPVALLAVAPKLSPPVARA